MLSITSSSSLGRGDYCLYLVADAVNNVQQLAGKGRFLPVPEGGGDPPSLGRDVVILLEDSPVPLRHFVQNFLLPVSVIPFLLGFFFGYDLLVFSVIILQHCIILYLHSNGISFQWNIRKLWQIFSNECHWSRERKIDIDFFRLFRGYLSL